MAEQTLAYVPEQERILYPNQICVALMDFDGQQEGDLSFRTGESISIVRPSDMMFWYIGKNSKEETGMVPGTCLQPLQDPPASMGPPAIDRQRSDTMESESEGYTTMNPAGEVPDIPPKSRMQRSEKLSREEQHIIKIKQMELRRRLPKGTLVVATTDYDGQREDEMSFGMHEEMMVIEPLSDLGWYYAQKAEHPSIRGVIPVTHIRLVYMSDEECDEEDLKGYRTPSAPAHDRLYDDKNDFVANSGWFTFPGMSEGKSALEHVLARKANMKYDKFMGVRKSVYRLKYRHEKVFIGKALNLCEELCQHFECFGKRRKDIREVDDELCHHTDASPWELTVWELTVDQNLELEWAKKVIESQALTSPDQEQKGLNEHLYVSDMESFDQLWHWWSPN